MDLFVSLMKETLGVENVGFVSGGIVLEALGIDNPALKGGTLDLFCSSRQTARVLRV
jgi:hypothetical protein